MRGEAQRHDELASRVGQSRPNQTRFETMWAHAGRLAAAHLFDPSLVEESETPCPDDDADESPDDAPKAR
jgi:hypothetical protein